MAEDTGAPIGEPIDTDAENDEVIRRPQHLKRSDPRAAEIEGPQNFRVNEEEARPEQGARRAPARRSKK